MKDIPKLNRGFFISWIVTFIFLYGISYLWHGIVLNDLNRVTYSLDVFLFFVGVIYFVVAFILTVLIHFLVQLSKNRIKRGIIIGIPMGIFIYLIAFVFGISFYSNPTLGHILLDLTWQIAEQAIGGIVAGSVLSLAEVFRTQKAF